MTCNPDEYSQVAAFLHSIALLIPSRPPTDERHPAREFLEHVGEMLEIAADKELRLFGRDVERLSRPRRSNTQFSSRAARGN